MSVTYSTKLILANRSGDLCAMPNCGHHLTTDIDGNTANIGVAAHIAGEHSGHPPTRKNRAARYDPNMTDEQRNSYPNLIYLCRNCHQEIDVIPHGENKYPVPFLSAVKTAHESKVQDAINNAFASVAFPELAAATHWADSAAVTPAEHNFQLLPPEEKIKVNELGNRSRLTITMGLSVSAEVRKFIEGCAQTDPIFPDKLAAGFLEEYYRLRKEGTPPGDDLFDLMCRFAQSGFTDQPRRSAGLAVFVYLFETCEVFEK